MTKVCFILTRDQIEYTYKIHELYRSHFDKFSIFVEVWDMSSNGFLSIV